MTLSRPLAWGLLVGLVIVVYGRSLDDPFHFDDHHAIVDNVNLHDLANVPRFFVDPGTFSADSTLTMYRPLLLTTFAANHAVSGLDGWSYHLLNVLVHAAVAVCLFELLARWSGRPPAALLGAALFALHPVNSETVAYVSSRSESLAAFFVLLALVWHGRSRCASLACFSAGLLAKSTAIVFLPLVWLHDVLLRRRSWRSATTRLIPVGAVAAAYMLFTRDLVARATLTEPVRGYGEQVWSQVKGLVYYAHLLAVPRGLTVDHQFQLSESPGDPYAASASMLLVSVAGLSLRAWQRQGGQHYRALLFFGLWVVVALAPASLVPLNVIVNEHRLYLAAGALAAGGAWVAGHSTRPLHHALLAAVALFGLLAWQRGAVWDSPHALWADAAHKAPDMARPRILLGQALLDDGRPEEAAARFAEGIERDPTFTAGYVWLARTQLDLGRIDDAIETAARATPVAAGESAVWALLADAFRARAGVAGDSAGVWYARSAEAYTRAVALEPGRSEYHDNLGNTLQVLGRPAEALVHHERAVALEPGSAASHLNHGNALWMLGRVAEAEAAWRQAVAVAPDYAPAWHSLAALYEQVGESDAARRARARAREGQP